MLVKGKVVADGDPMQIGRVRVRIRPMHDGVPDGHLPWAMPVVASFGDGACCTPTVGTEVFTDQSDPQEPLYYGNTISPDTLPAHLKTNYPDRKGLETESGTRFHFDESDGSILLETSTGATVEIDASGRILIESPERITLKVVGNEGVMTSSATTFSKHVTITGGLQVNGGGVRHNSRNIGDTHNHPESIGSVTGPPNA